MTRHLPSILALVLGASSVTAQKAARAWIDPTTGTFPTRPGRVEVPIASPVGCGETIGYTTNAAFPHLVTLAATGTAFSDLMADGHVLVPVNALVPGALDGLDTLVVGLALDETAVPESEKVDVIESFVLSGGKLVFLGDNNRFFHLSNELVGGRFGLGYPLLDPSQNFFTDIADHPMTRGPRGEVHVIDLTVNVPTFVGSVSDLGPHGNGLVRFAGDNRSLWPNTFDYQGICTFDLETGDDFSTPLVNGQALSSPAGFAHIVALSSSGPNAGAAAFDSDLADRTTRVRTGTSSSGAGT